jgi:histidinol-phosphatase (PHP family)
MTGHRSSIPTAACVSIEVDMTTDAVNTRLVSVHGGHTAEFGDGEDSLAAVVAEYVRQDFDWVGITEHIPPVSDAFLFHEDREAGETAASKRARFADYFSTARLLQSEHSSKLQILVGFETECCTGYVDHVDELRREFKPDYIVGSVHHVRDVVIDGRSKWYAEAIACVGGIEELYCEYFDQQYQMMEALRPEVIGHFDLIRFHDADYHERFRVSEIKDRIWRNLEKAKEIDSILDLNLRALEKGASEPYVSRSILEMASEIGVKCVPGDDSHGVATVGRHLGRGIELLEETGYGVEWPKPRGCA